MVTAWIVVRSLLKPYARLGIRLHTESAVDTSVCIR
jgi:hypothetical protein